MFEPLQWVSTGPYLGFFVCGGKLGFRDISDQYSYKKQPSKIISWRGQLPPPPPRYVRPWSNPTRTGRREEDYLREARVVRSNHMSNPPQLWFHDECLNAWHVGSAQQFCLGDSIFPGDAHNRLCLELLIIFQRWKRFVKFVHSDEIS